MRICIYGAGAVGGLIAARLAQAGREVSIVARGANASALRAEGLRFRADPQAEPVTLRLPVFDRGADAGPQDLEVVAAKAQSLPAMAADLAAALAPGGAALFAVNGVPWWYLHGLPGAGGDARLRSVDPRGELAAHVGAARTIGAAVFLAAERDAPGRVTQHAPARLVIGAADAGMAARIGAVAAALDVPGCRVEASARIRDHVALKFSGNVATNPLCALVRAPIGRVYADPAMAAFGASAMREAVAVAEALGARVDVDVAARVAQYREGPLSPFRTSTLLDVDFGRPLEIDALVGAIAELGRRAGVATPAVDLTYGMIRALAERLGLYVPP